MSLSRVHRNGVLVRVVLRFSGISSTQAPWRAVLYVLPMTEGQTEGQEPQQVGLSSRLPCSATSGGRRRRLSHPPGK